MNPPQKIYEAVLHRVNLSSPEEPKDLLFFDPDSDYLSPCFSVKTRDRKS